MTIFLRDIVSVLPSDSLIPEDSDKIFLNKTIKFDIFYFISNLYILCERTNFNILKWELINLKDHYEVV